MRLVRASAAGLAIGTRQTIYTVPAGKMAILRTVTQAFDGAAGGGAQWMGLLLNNVGFLWVNVMTDPQVSKTWNMGTVLYPGDTLSVEHQENSGYTMCLLDELDVRDGPTIQRVNLLDVGTSQKAYAVPAGKRFRIREVVFSPHNQGCQLNLYIGGIGYIARRTIAGNAPEVHHVDLLALPNESIGAVSTPVTPLNVWLSGELIDA